LDFYSQPDAPYTTKAKPKEWAQVQAELQQLKNATAAVLPTSASGGADSKSEAAAVAAPNMQ
jgi:hypothetical protein